MAKGLFGKILKGVLIGGGTILSAVCPPVGVGVMSVGMAIGKGAAAVGGLIKQKAPTVDNVVNTVNAKLNQAGLLQPVAPMVVPQVTANTYGSFTINPLYILFAVGALVLLLLFKKRK